MEIFSNKNRSVFSNEVENSLNIDFSTKVRLLPNENLSQNFSLNEQYNKERDNCNNFRLIVSINPVCSNVLFNAKTEIIINEGSSDVKVICDCKDGSQEKKDVAISATNTTSEITYLDAIRNTEYSHPKLGGFTYHCGYDIFNNHMLRNDSYVHINKLGGSSDGKNYNTLGDFSRNAQGDIIKQDLSLQNDKNEIERHLYQFDNVLSMRTAFYERCKEHDGWWGFVNPSYINIPNREDVNILTNTLINNKKSCEFIDLYPDRSLYSFIPKYNKFRNRLEKNWDYCITYPYENDEKKINTICAPNYSAHNFSIRVDFIKKFNTGGNEILECHSYFKHNLKPSDTITLYYYTDNNGVIQKFGKKIIVENVGDGIGMNKDKIFTIKYSDIQSIYNDLDITNQKGFYYKRNSGGEECQYYFRKFKKLKNFDGSELKSDVNKIAFGKNIYGDDVAQIIFTDNINVEGLLDNRGRPISEVFLTVIKRNAGHDIWYEEGTNPDSKKNNEKIEFSHCFGKVTSGLDFSGVKNEPNDYNIHKLHNLEFSDNKEFLSLFNNKEVYDIEFHKSDGGVGVHYISGETPSSIGNSLTHEEFPTSDEIFRTFEMWGDSVVYAPKFLEDNITIDNDVFDGDVVEYDLINAKETVISQVYHRVNTAQRETFDKCFRDILQDKITKDDYDTIVMNKKFEIKTYYLNDAENAESVWGPTSTIDDVIRVGEGKKALIYGNIMPEGNYYKPHTLIRLKSENSVTSSSPAKLINYGEMGLSLSVSGTVLTFIYPTNYGFYKGDYIAFYNVKNNRTYWNEITNVDTSNRMITIELNEKLIGYTKTDFIGNTRILYAYWSPNNVPIYASLCPKSRNFVWRTLLSQSELKSSDELYNTTFSNGCLYIEKNINFFLRRQDPFGNYGLSKPLFKKLKKSISNPMDDFIIGGAKQADFSGVIYAINNFDNCY